IAKKISGDNSVTAVSVSSQLSDVVTKTSALLETTSQAFSVVLDGAVEEGDVFSLVIGGETVSYTVTADDVTASVDVSPPLTVIRDKLIAAVESSDVEVASSAAFSGNELVLTVDASSSAIAVSAAMSDSGESSGIAVSATGIESALMGFETSLTALSGVTGAIGEAVDAVVANAAAVEVYSSTVDVNEALIRGGPDYSLIKNSDGTGYLDLAIIAAQNAQSLVAGTQSWADQATARAIYSESSAAQAQAGQSQYAQSLSKTVQEEALRIAQELANARPVAADDVDALAEDASVIMDLLQNDKRADGDPLVGATLLSVGAATNGDIEILAQQELVTFSGAGAGVTYTLTLEGHEIFYQGLSYENAASVANKVVEVINSNISINETIIASSESDGVIRISASQAGQPFTIAEDDGNISIAHDVVNGSVRYTPNANYNGNDSFTYTVANDADVPSYSSATVRVEVSAVNDGPTSVDDFGTVVSAVGSSVRVLSNDTDIDGDALTISQVTFEGVTRAISGETTITGGDTGSVVVVNPTNGRISFVPESDWYKELSAGDVEQKTIEYTVVDPDGAASSSSLTLTVQGVNDAPEVTSSAITLSGTEDNPDTITIGGVIEAGDEYSISVQHGSSDAITVNYTVTGNESNLAEIEAALVNLLMSNETLGSVIDAVSGPDISGIEIRSKDSGLISTSATATDAGAVSNLTATVVDGAITGNLSSYASDPDDNSSLTYSVAAGGNPENGTLSVKPDGTFSYQPNGNYNGADGFIFRVVDENGVAATKSIALDIASVNDAPIVVGEVVQLAANKSVVLRVLDNDSDIEGQDISLKLDSVSFGGAEGSVTAVQNTDGTITITPNVEHALFVDLGKDQAAAVQTISYTVEDTEGGETTGQVDLTVLGVEGPPVALNDAGNVTEGGSVVIDVLDNDRDKDGDTLRVLTPTAGSFGATRLNDDGTITYTASASTLESLGVNDTEVDTFAYSVTDGTNFTEATVTVTIQGENDVPITTNDVARAKENGDAVLIDVFYNDRDVDEGDTLTLQMPELVSEKAAALIMVNADRVVLGGTLEVGDAYSVTFTIGGVEQSPLTKVVTADDTEITDIELALIELINTHETISGFLTATSGPANGILLVSAKNPDTVFETSASTVNATGGDFDDTSATATRTKVVSYNPTTGQITEIEHQDISHAALAEAGFDVGSDVEVVAGTYVITINDVPVEVDVTGPKTVGELNNAFAAAINADAGLSAKVFATGNDSTLVVKGLDASPFTVNFSASGGEITDAAHNGNASRSWASVKTASPDAFNAMDAGDKIVDTFSYKALDETSDPNDISLTRVNITVGGANDRPDAFNDTYTGVIQEDGDYHEIDVLSNDTDADEDDTPETLIVNSVTSENGATITIGYYYDLDPETGKEIQIQGTPQKVYYDPRKLDSVLDETDVNGSPIKVGKFISVPAFDALGEGETTQDTVTYTIRDASGAISEEAELTVTVTGTNDAPVAGVERYAAFKGSALNVDQVSEGVLANDTDPDSDDQGSLQVVAGEVTSKLGVTVILYSDGRFEYDPTTSTAFDDLSATSSDRDDEFKYKVIDPQGEETESTVYVGVTGVLPKSDVQLSGGSETVTLDAIIQEALKGTAQSDALTLSGKAVSGDAFDGGDGTDTLVLDGSGNNEISVKNTEVISGGAGDDRIIIDGPGTDGADITISSGGGSDAIALSEGFEFKSAERSGDDLVVTADYTNPDVASAETETVAVTLEDHASAPFSSLEIDADGDGLIDPESEIFSLTADVEEDALIVGTDGDDVLTGGENDDLLIGGAGADTIDGGSGDDTIQVGAGNDTIDGGDGVDTLSLGSVSEGATVNLAMGTSTVGSDTDAVTNIENVRGGSGVDTVTGDDGANTIDGGGAADNIDAGGGDDLVVGGDGSDTLRGGAGNDVIYGDALGDGGSVSGSQSGLALAQSIDVMGMPASEFDDVSVLSDKDVRGFQSGQGAVGLTRSMTPDDEGFANQWYLDNPNAILGGVDIDIEAVWDDYSGNGVSVGIIDDGIDYAHVDIVENYNNAIDFDALDEVLGLGSDDPMSDGVDDFHGTAVAGVIGGSLGGGDVVGVAYEASLAMFRMGFGFEASASQTEAVLQQMVNVDVVNSSWTYGEAFTDNKNELKSAEFFEAITGAVDAGREGLGTVIVFAAGNYGEDGDSSDYHSFSNTHETISVGSVGLFGSASSFTSAGSSILLSAPGEDIYTTDLSGAGGFSTGDYFENFSGTSAAAPIVSGVVALMLEANPDLGYRDVQEILAYSAANPNDNVWMGNAAGNANGGGLTFTDDYGFGIVDAHAAVRLAETWTKQSTYDNMVSASSAIKTVESDIPDGGVLTSTITVSGDQVDIDHVEVNVQLSHDYIGDLLIEITSPVELGAPCLTGRWVVTTRAQVLSILHSIVSSSGGRRLTAIGQFRSLILRLKNSHLHRRLTLGHWISLVIWQKIILPTFLQMTGTRLELMLHVTRLKMQLVWILSILLP
ncbi:MAG: hypothetical protein CL573_05310, partial [Alphaproteobacteria bacterium]|nr:hypothetical protein [Alphaproteobacteria bacterium]